jgi:hypothetical protein
MPKDKIIMVRDKETGKTELRCYPVCDVAQAEYKQQNPTGPGYVVLGSNEAASLFVQTVDSFTRGMKEILEEKIRKEMPKGA